MAVLANGLFPRSFHPEAPRRRCDTCGSQKKLSGASQEGMTRQQIFHRCDLSPDSDFTVLQQLASTSLVSRSRSRLRQLGGESELATEDARFSSTSPGSRDSRCAARVIVEMPQNLLLAKHPVSHPAESLWLGRGTISYGRTTYAILLDTRSWVPSLLPGRFSPGETISTITRAGSAKEDRESAIRLLQSKGIQLADFSATRKCPISSGPGPVKWHPLLSNSPRLLKRKRV
jgi:hypothetical protein